MFSQSIEVEHILSWVVLAIGLADLKIGAIEK